MYVWVSLTEGEGGGGVLCEGVGRAKHSEVFHPLHIYIEKMYICITFPALGTKNWFGEFITDN